MQREIPGYYYDADKKKYFKIEDSKTAPRQAAWSANNVDKRQRQQHEVRQYSGKRRRPQRTEGGRAVRPPVKRARCLLSEPLTGGSLLRETIGGPHVGRHDRASRYWSGGSQAIAGYGGGRDDVPVVVSPQEMPIISWARGLREKGHVTIGERYSGSVVTQMYIGSQESETNFGAVYGALNDTVLTYTYIPRDENDRIISLPKAEARLGRNLRAGRFPALLGRMPQISSITYHAPSHRLLVTSRHPDHFVCTSTPVFAIDEHIDSTPSFSNNLVPHRLEYYRAPKGQVNTCVPAPEAASDLIGVLGTSRGIYVLRHDCTVGLLTPPLSRKGAFMGSPREKEEHERMSITPAYGGEVFSLDYLRRNPKEVVVAGGRSNRIDLIDMRAPRDEWAWIQHQSSAAHVKSVGDNEILVAGPMSAMSIYDIRYSNKRCSQPTSTSTSTSTYPVVTFPEYKNDAHIHHIGLDVQTDYGVVAAAHDDGRVALYSLYSGTQLRFMPDIDTQEGGNGLLDDRGTAAEPPQRPPVVKCLMFQTLPGDRHPSLFVGEGSRIKKHSFGVRDDDDDDDNKGVATEE